MSRLPFDPDRLPALDAGQPALRERARYGEFGGAGALTVTQVAELLKRVLADRMPSTVKIVGEVSNFNDRGHWYFSLKDEASCLSCVMWAAAAKKCGFLPERGRQVVAAGRIDFYGPQGKVQLYVEEMEPVGQGVLEMRYRQLCEELRKGGYFDESRKRPMPAFPEHIAIVTSAGGAALQDVTRTARQRWAGIRLSVMDVRVQGDGAAEQVARAVTLLSDQHKRLSIDAVILTRGGGSLEDLWAFNERVVAEAVFRSKVPIAVGVGHETDTTIAELVADLRCSTPTQAAARLVPDAMAERHRVDQSAHRMAHCLRRKGEHAQLRLDALAGHAIFRRPADRFRQLTDRLRHETVKLNAAIRDRLNRLRSKVDGHRHELACIEPVTKLKAARQRLQQADRMLSAAAGRSLTDRRSQLLALERQLHGIGPGSVLNRGYTYTTDLTGRLLQSVTAARHAQSLVTHFADGQVESQVNSSPQAFPPSYKRRKKVAADIDQAGLFTA